MKIAYLILAHKNFLQLDRMVAALQGEEVFFFIHVDKDSKINGLRSLKNLSLPNVHFLSKRFSINWGGFNMVLATLELMRMACKLKGKAFQILLSAQDFPLFSSQVIRNFLSQNYGKEFIESWSLPYAKWADGGLNRIQQYWFVDGIGMEESRIIADLQRASGFKRNGISSFPVFGGPQWWCLTDLSVRYVLRLIKRNPVLIEFFERTLIPDELFFQSILLNSPFSQNIVHNNLRYIVFEDGASHPKILKSNAARDVQSSGKLWARKFDLYEDLEILDILEDSFLESNNFGLPNLLNSQTNSLTI